MPHRTIADFALVFFNNRTSDSSDVTHTLFQLVTNTKQLNGMPVLPNTLRVKGEKDVLFFSFAKVPDLLSRK